MILQSSVNRAFHSSMEVGVKVLVESYINGTHKHVSSALLTFVAVDREVHRLPVPPVIPETDEEKRRYEEAGRRREMREQERKEKSRFCPEKRRGLTSCRVTSHNVATKWGKLTSERCSRQSQSTRMVQTMTFSWERRHSVVFVVLLAGQALGVWVDGELPRSFWRLFETCHCAVVLMFLPGCVHWFRVL